MTAGPNPILREIVETLGLSPTAQQNQQLEMFHVELGRWGQIINLSAIRDPDEQWRLHVADCLAVIQPLHACIEVARSDNPQAPALEGLLDIGSGAGLPGLLLAILLPHLQVFSVEKVQKKAAFQRHVATLLGLKNVRVLAERIETIPSLMVTDTICRAFSEVETFLQLSALHVCAWGRAHAMRGKLAGAETGNHSGLDQKLPQEQGWRLLCSTPLRVPQLAASRHLQSFERV